MTWPCGGKIVSAQLDRGLNYDNNNFCWSFSVKQTALFSAFSVYSNGKKLFETNEASSKDIIDCLHGIRALSIMWIIHGHRVQTYSFFPLMNKTQFREVRTWRRCSRASLKLSIRFNCSNGSARGLRCFPLQRRWRSIHFLCWVVCSQRAAFWGNWMKGENIVHWQFN